jgi:hypothetical protein
MRELVIFKILSICKHRFNMYLFSVDLREVKEVRLGKCSKDFDRWAEDARKFENNRCYVVFYGNEFCLKTLSIGG